jgi:hypothetical protein
MSYVTIYAVQAGGDVTEIANASNNHVAAPLVWRALGAKYGYLDPQSHPYFLADPGIEVMWAEWPSPKMSHTENVLLGSTFDNVWVARDALPELIKGWEKFLDQYIRTHKLDDRAAVGIIAALREAHENATVRGVAFNMCSANESPWVVEDEDGDDCLPFNIDTPPADTRAWELTQRMREAAEEPPE